MRARRIGLIAIVVTAGIAVGGFVDGFGQEPSAEGTVQAFLLAWQRHDYRAAAAYTTGRAPAVSGALADAFTQLDATAMFLSMGRVDQNGDTAEAHFSASVNLGEGGHQWTYAGQFALRRSGSGWKVQWAPSVINPQLGPGERLAVITQVPARGQVLDAAGQPLEVPSAVYQVGVWPRALAEPGRDGRGLRRGDPAQRRPGAGPDPGRPARAVPHPALARPGLLRRAGAGAGAGPRPAGAPGQPAAVLLRSQ